MRRYKISSCFVQPNRCKTPRFSVQSSVPWSCLDPLLVCLNQRFAFIMMPDWPPAYRLRFDKLENVNDGITGTCNIKLACCDIT